MKMDIYNEVSNFSLIKNDNNISFIFSELSDVNVIEVVSKLFTAFEYCPWIFSLIGSILVGLSGVFPLLVIPIEEGENLKSGGEILIFNTFSVKILIALGQHVNVTY